MFRIFFLQRSLLLAKSSFSITTGLKASTDRFAMMALASPKEPEVLTETTVISGKPIVINTLHPLSSRRKRYEIACGFFIASRITSCP